MLWMGIGVWIGMDALAHPEAVALRLQPPAPAFVAEERNLDSHQRELRLQIGSQGIPIHPYIDEFILLSLESRKLRCLDQQAGLDDHDFSSQHLSSPAPRSGGSG